MARKLKTKEKEKGLYLTESHASAIQKIGEDAANATIRTQTQVLLAIEEILEEHFKFSKNDMKEFGHQLKWMMSTLYNLKRDSLTVISPREMRIVGEIARRWAVEEQQGKLGIHLPESEVIKPKLIK